MQRIIRVAVLLLVSVPLVALATAQIPDEIVLDGEPSRLHSQPLDALLWRKPESVGSKLAWPRGTCSANWRGYRAFWQILDNRLHLDKVVLSACDAEPKLVEIDSLLPGKQAPVPADWYTGVLTIPKGKKTQDVHMGYLSTYERYVILVVKKGLVVSRVDLDEPPQ
jgi:hypothetical protein